MRATRERNRDDTMNNRARLVSLVACLALALRGASCQLGDNAESASSDKLKGHRMPGDYEDFIIDNELLPTEPSAGNDRPLNAMSLDEIRNLMRDENNGGAPREGDGDEDENGGEPRNVEPNDEYPSPDGRGQGDDGYIIPLSLRGDAPKRSSVRKTRDLRSVMAIPPGSNAGALVQKVYLTKNRVEKKKDTINLKNDAIDSKKDSNESPKGTKLLKGELNTNGNYANEFNNVLGLPNGQNGLRKIEMFDASRKKYINLLLTKNEVPSNEVVPLTELPELSGAVFVDDGPDDGLNDYFNFKVYEYALIGDEIEATTKDWDSNEIKTQNYSAQFEQMGEMVTVDYEIPIVNHFIDDGGLHKFVE